MTDAAAQNDNSTPLPLGHLVSLTIAVPDVGRGGGVRDPPRLSPDRNRLCAQDAGAVLGRAKERRCTLWLADAGKRRRGLLALRRRARFETPIRTINDAFGFTEDERHPITTVNLPGQSYIEIDQYPYLAAKRRSESGYLLPGIAVVTFEGHGLDDLPLYWLGEPMVLDMAPYMGRRQVTFYGGAGEMIELIETG